MYTACFLSFFVGFLSLMQEILWIRLFGYTNHSQPQAFSFVLGCYLIGISIGAIIGKKICTSKHNLWEISGIILLISSIFDLISPWAYADLSTSNWQLLVGGTLIIITALLKAIIFPIAHHLGASPVGTHVGRSISRVYVSNIMGATLGPIITGAFLLDMFSTQQCFYLCAGMTFLVSFFCLSEKLRGTSLAMMSLFAVIMASFTFLHNPSELIAKVSSNAANIQHIYENRHGIVTLYKSDRGGDYVYGGNVYDGRTNLDPIINSNHINRLLILAALQNQPTHVLMIGLSIGTWLKLVTSFPGVQTIDVIEINSGYLKAMKNYPHQESALQDNRVQLYIDDGRRWLKAHPDKKYDLIIMNTTFFWRAYSANLLSREFLTLLKQHMSSHAILSYNSTGSPDVLKTANEVFSCARLYENFVTAADFDWTNNLYSQAALHSLANLKLDGRLLFPRGSEKTIARYLHEPLTSSSDLETTAALGRKLEVITDMNLLTEYKYGKSLVR